MTKKPKRKLAFRTEHQGNPLSYARLTDYEFNNGAIFIIEMDGKVRELSLRYTDIHFVTMFSALHHRLDKEKRVTVSHGDSSRTLPYAVETFLNFDHFLLFWKREKEKAASHFKFKTTDEGEPVTEHHEQLIQLLAYANLPVWAKDETAFLKRWGKTDAYHSFHGLLAPIERHRDVVRFERNNQQRRAA